jgi:hypothetical protein
MQQLARRFHDFFSKEIEGIKKTHIQYKTDKNRRLKKDWEQKFPFLTRKPALPGFDEIISWQNIKTHFSYETEIIPLIEYYISKITGIYKHGQSDTTTLCNLRILANVRLGKTSIGITKNTLNAKEQWESRLISDLKKKFPKENLKELIIVISSKFNDLGGNATHCKNIDDAISKFTRGSFKIIFVCSNNTRINDILTFLVSYHGFSEDKRLPIDCQQDEAHNLEEGVPSKRIQIEHIVMNPYIETFVPVTASYETLIDPEKALWQKSNLDRYAIDYTQYSQTLSTSENYSSISDAIPVYFEDLMEHKEYKDYGIVEFDEETLKEADPPGYYNTKQWKDKPKEEINEDKEKRRKLEFNSFFAQEKLACNLGMNLLDNYYTSEYERNGNDIITPIFLTDIMNLHILTTPRRVMLTIYLMKYAVNQSYKPLCIGLYRSEIHIRYKNKHGQIIKQKYSDVINESDTNEMNEKIHELLEHIVKIGESIDRPVIIFGNYKPTGESITFVSYKYGTVRSSVVLPSSFQTREMSYQAFLRTCYQDKKFRENSPDGKFEHPDKFIVGFKKNIDEALYYEKQNDERIFGLLTNSNTSENKPIAHKPKIEDDNSNISIPVKITIWDMEDESVKKLRNILKKSKRDDNDKKQTLALICDMIKSGTATFSDPSNKFDFNKFTLTDIRCYKNDLNAENYRFSSYDSKHETRMPYINNKSEIKENNCELLASFDKYEYDGFVNHRSWIWLSYRFE